MLSLFRRPELRAAGTRRSLGWSCHGRVRTFATVQEPPVPAEPTSPETPSDSPEPTPGVSAEPTSPEAVAEPPPAASGPDGWTNWRAQRGGVPGSGAIEFAEYTDAQLLEDQVDLGPCRLLNTIGFAARQAGQVPLSLVLRVEWHAATDPRERSREETDTAAWHGGRLDDELAALVSLALGIRLQSGGRIREFDPDGDVRGRPVHFDHVPPYLPPPRRAPLLPTIIGPAQLGEASGRLAGYPQLTAAQANALVKAARAWQEAVWVADADPRQAWLRLVSALEAAAQAWAGGPARSPEERLLITRPRLAKRLARDARAAPLRGQGPRRDLQGHREVRRLHHGPSARPAGPPPARGVPARLAAHDGAPGVGVRVALAGPARRHPDPRADVRAAVPARGASCSDRGPARAGHLDRQRHLDQGRHPDAVAHLRVHHPRDPAQLAGGHDHRGDWDGRARMTSRGEPVADPRATTGPRAWEAPRARRCATSGPAPLRSRRPPSRSASRRAGGRTAGRLGLESSGRGGYASAILPGMTPGRLPLPDEAWPKARRYMRALRRGLLAYWYATLEDTEAAAIEAATVTWYINILDEAVFEQAHGEPYKDLRANDRLGRVVMGLELIRNCETHAPVVFDELLVKPIAYSVPLAVGGPPVMRSVLAWAAHAGLPARYRDVPSSATAAQRRARGEALDGYRKAVQLRHVIETLLDAMAFFESLDARLVGPTAPSLRWAFAELPDTDPESAKPTRWYVARPLGLDTSEPFLPDIVCRNTERRTAQWPPADHTLKERAKQARKELPYASAREVRHVLTKGAVVVGYSGFQPEPHGASRWVERRRQVWQDVRKGARYFLVHDGHEIDLQCNGHERVNARLSDGRDTLADLPEATKGGLDMGLLQMVEDYPDLYLQMRRPPSLTRDR